MFSPEEVGNPWQLVVGFGDFLLLEISRSLFFSQLEKKNKNNPQVEWTFFVTHQLGIFRELSGHRFLMCLF